ncbi:MAG TPA: hypothetical protein VFP84_37965 [Kofleriaceae bacterium]|nr:hypothetical protein [Kofleriaceae bacterium]
MTHSHAIVAERLETLLLVRLALARKPPSVKELAKATSRYRPTTLGNAEWDAHVEQAVQRLAAHQVITAERTLARDDEVKRRVGATAATKWEQWTDKLLPALALGVRADDAKALKAFSIANSWITAVAARALGAWTTGAPPALAAFADALVWRELGLDGPVKECPAAVRAYALRKHTTARGPSPISLVKQIAAHAVGAANTDLDKLRDALVRQWLLGKTVGDDAAGPAPAPTAAAPSLIADVRRIVADATGDAVFGDRKVFISRVWDALHATAAWANLALADFKHQLLALHRQQALVLARADLVSAMDPALVDASETRTDGATFHFIVRDPDRKVIP